MSSDDALHDALLGYRQGRIPAEDVLKVLGEAEVFIPRRPDAGRLREGERELQHDEQLELPVVEAPDGRRFVPLFSSLANMTAAVPDETPYIRLPFAALAENWPRDVQAVVDPGGPVEFPVPAQGGLRERVPAGTRIFVGDPAEEPREVLEALSAVFREEPAVRAAYRAQVYVEAPDERPHIAIGVLLEGQASEESLFARASEAARAVRDDLPLSFLVIEADAPNAVTAHMLGESAPFYVAKT